MLPKKLILLLLVVLAIVIVIYAIFVGVAYLFSL